MSLYVFDIYEDHATVSADSRICTTYNGKIYRIHDHQQKLYVVDDIIITVGGVAWICAYIMERFKANRIHTAKALHQIGLDTVPRLDQLALSFGASLEQHRNNDYAFEACIVRFDPVKGHNVFCNIATYNKCQLASVDVWSGGQSHIVTYGGIDFHIVHDYMETHKAESKTDYVATLLKGYEAAASEKVGGTLSVAIQNRKNVQLEKYPIRDSGKLLEYSDLTGTTLIGHNIIGQQLMMTCPDEEGKPIHFQFDSLGLYSYNARQYWRGESGGFVLLDPDYGFMLGTEGDPLVVDNKGRVHPSCIDENNELIFEDMGKYSTKKIPKGMNLYMGVDGNLYMRGDFYANDIYVENGTFNGVIKAQDFQLPSGDSMVSVLNSQGQIKSNWLDLIGINIKDPATGETMMTIDGTKGITINKGSISWGAVTGTQEIDQRIQNAQSAADDAYDEASSVNSNLLKLVQGKYTTPKSTFIDGTTVKSPTIEAGTITGAKIYGSDIYGGAFYDLNGKSKLVLNPSSSHNNYADLILYGGGSGSEIAFGIYDDIGAVTISGYGIPSMRISKWTGGTHAIGTWDFSNANVSGIYAKFK